MRKLVWYTKLNFLGRIISTGLVTRLMNRETLFIYAQLQYFSVGACFNLPGALSFPNNVYDCKGMLSTCTWWYCNQISPYVLRISPMQFNLAHQIVLQQEANIFVRTVSGYWCFVLDKGLKHVMAVLWFACNVHIHVRLCQLGIPCSLFGSHSWCNH